jgi:uncharacterized protein (UPF0261 family)
MASVAQLVDQELLSWPGVSAQPHRFGGREYHVNNHEIGHMHGSHMADLPFPKKVRDELVAAGRVQPHHILPETGWVSFYISGEADASAVVALFRLNYERLTKRASVSG